LRPLRLGHRFTRITQIKTCTFLQSNPGLSLICVHLHKSVARFSVLQSPIGNAYHSSFIILHSSFESSTSPFAIRRVRPYNVSPTRTPTHDGSAPTLDDAVRKMGKAQLNTLLTDPQVTAIVAFLHSLTGNYRGVPVGGPP